MKIRTYYTLLILLSGLLFFGSCEDPVDLDLGPPATQIVVDAVVSNTADTQYIRVYKSIPYLQQTSMPGYSVDSVVIIDTLFNVYTFKNKGNGEYFYIPQSASPFSVGMAYQLLIIDGDRTYVSRSVLNRPSLVDSLSLRYYPEGYFGQKGTEGNYAELFAKDPVGRGDCMWFKFYRNDTFQNSGGNINTSFDNSFSPGGDGDGAEYILPLRFFPYNSRAYKSGEKAKIEILSITIEMYYYLNQISTQLGNTGLFAVPPSNIKSNIFCISHPDQEVLGFFNMSSKIVVEATAP